MQLRVRDVLVPVSKGLVSKALVFRRGPLALFQGRQGRAILLLVIQPCSTPSP